MADSMSSAATASPSSVARSERTILLTLAAIQFTHVLDFMIMMPLGAELMRVFELTPAQFSHLVAAYGGSAAVAGLAGGFFLDRMERRRALLGFYTGFLLATFACAIAPTHHALLAARVLAGVFGGLAGSLVVACVGDIVPPERRGRGMAFVMSAFPLASIAGVPLGIMLANRYEWHAPFYLIVALGLPILLLAARILPRRIADAATLAAHPFQQMRELLTEAIHWRGFAVTASLVAASGCIVPFMAPSLIANVGISEAKLPWVYFCGGIATFAFTPLMGWLTDRHDKLHVLAGITLPAAVSVFFLTRLGPSPLWMVLPLSAMFFVGMSGRFSPASTLVLNSVDPRHRGGFTSLNAAVQSGGVALANLIGGALISRDAAGRLVGYPLVGWFAIAMFALTLVLAHRLRAAAPHAARNLFDPQTAA